MCGKKNQQRVATMKNLIRKTIIFLFAIVCFLPFMRAGILTDRAGIGNVANPTDLEISGKVTCSSFTLTTSPSLNYVITSDASGKGTWQPEILLLNSVNTWTAPNTWNSSGTFVSNLTINGDVGISTGAPSYSLDVYGFVRTTVGFVCPDSTVIDSSFANLFVPYTGAIKDVNLGSWGIKAASATFSSNVIVGSPYTKATSPELIVTNTTGSVNVISGYGNNNNYVQLNIQNKNSGNNASSEIVATGNNGNSNYIHMGILSSGYSASGSIFGANDGFLEVFGLNSNFEIGTASTGTVIKFHTGGTTSADERMRIDASGNVGIGTTTVSQALVVNGNFLETGPAWGAGGYAYMFLGDTTSYINSGYGIGITIQANGSPNAITIPQSAAGTGLGVAIGSVNEMLCDAGRVSLLEITSPSNTAGYGKVYANSSDKQLYYQDENSNKTQLGYDYAVIEDTKTSGTDGGTGSTVGWYQRTLSTTTASKGSSITLSSNQITLTTGTYRVVATVPFYATNNCKARFYNITDGTTAIYGTSNYQDSDDLSGFSSIDGIVTITANKNFRVEYYISNSAGTQDLGAAASTGEPEVYTRVFIQKIN